MSRFNHQKYRPAAVMQMPNRQWPSRQITQAPVWASVDLRDGNQALLEPMNVEQKRNLWKLLVKMGFKQIEVGFPSASQPDFDFVRWLIEENQIPDDVTVQVLVQARQALIDRTFEALIGAKRAIVHVYNSTSRVQREKVFGMDRQGISDIARNGAEMVQNGARQYPDTDWTFEYSPESFTSTEMDYAVEVCNAVIDVWQPTPEKPCIINLPATVEVSTPNVFADQVEYFCSHVNNRDSIQVSVHTHNDRGCAVAAAELAVLAGADRVEGTLLGNGERTGNMDVMTMAMNLYSQGVDPLLDISNPDEIIQVTTECTNMPVSPRHPWIGELVYTAFSGSHQDAINKCLAVQEEDEAWDVAYLPIDPADLGRDYQAVIRVNSQSGKGGVAFVMEREYGMKLPRWAQVELAQVVQSESEKQGGEVSSADIYRLFQETFMPTAQDVKLSGYELVKNGKDHINMRIDDHGKMHQVEGQGDGAISAFADAWKRYCGQEVHVVDYAEHSMGEGTDAEAASYVQLNVNGNRVIGVAKHQDTVSAALNAVISALNRSSVKLAKAG